MESMSNNLPEDGGADVLTKPENEDDFVLPVGRHRIAGQLRSAVGQHRHVPQWHICETREEEEKN